MNAASRVTKKPKQPTTNGKPEAIPQLRDGDRLDADEILSRYAVDPIVHSAELLRGVVHITRWREYQNGEAVIRPGIIIDRAAASSKICGFLGIYSAYTFGTEGYFRATTVFSSGKTCLEPEVALRLLPECAGSSIIGNDGFVHGTPELLAEISFTSGASDFGRKFDSYQADGVPEYIVWRTA